MATITTNEDPQPKSDLIPKSLSDALIFGSATGLSSFALGIPFEQAIRVALAGGSVSLFIHWSKSVKLGISDGKVRKTNRKPLGDRIKMNTSQGSRYIKRFDYALGGEPAEITVRGWGDLWRSLAGSRDRPQVIEQRVSVPKPAELDQFVFRSKDKSGQMIELLSSDVRRFLAIAWHNRDRGSGLGARRWGYRNRHQWSEWYRGLGPPWYEAMLGLLIQSQRIAKCQMVIQLGHQQYGLKFDNRVSYSILLYVESEKEVICV